MRGVGSWAVLTACGVMLSGCVGGIRHNDVLIFGTDTKVALDVSASATTGGTPEVTIGYKRQEAVWMPLIVNGAGIDPATLHPVCQDQQGNAAICVPDINALKYVGQAETPTGQSSGRDAYSVFASFGADIKGSGASPPTAGVGLAQFFATGIAAQRLASNSQVANVLALHPEGTGTAIAEAGGLSPSVQAAVAAGQIQMAANQKNAAALSACATLKAPARLSSLAGTAPTDPTQAALWPGFTAALDAASTTADFSQVIARYRPDFATQISQVITRCGGTPV